MLEDERERETEREYKVQFTIMEHITLRLMI